MWRLFPGCSRPPEQSIKLERLSTTVTFHWPLNINSVPIDYAFRPCLRGRLTLRGLTLRRNPWTFGESVSHTLSRYSCPHSRFRYLQQTSRFTFTDLRNAPLPLEQKFKSQASVRDLIPDTSSAPDLLFRPVSYYAFFK
jgi:hypothetical protein